MTQLTIFDALARRTDPPTSHTAARSVNAALPRLEAIVLDALRRAGTAGLTSWELADATGLDRVTASPRLAPLAAKGLALASEVRRLGPSGRAGIVWVATNSGVARLGAAGPG